jgi:hypothetical protein
MNLNPLERKAIRELGDAINSVVEKSAVVRDAIDRIRGFGYEANISLNLEIGLLEIERKEIDDPEIEFSEDDVKALHRMKIRIDDLE